MEVNDENQVGEILKYKIRCPIYGVRLHMSKLKQHSQALRKSRLLKRLLSCSHLSYKLKAINEEQSRNSWKGQVNNPYRSGSCQY